MSKNNQNKTISCNSNGMVISYGDVNKHQFMRYETPSYVRKIQLEGTVKYQKVLNPKQNELFTNLVYGFKKFTREELNQMPEQAKIDLKVNYTRAQRILNKWKQDLTFSFIDKLLVSLFPKSPVVKEIVNTTGYVNEIAKEDELSFKDLGITDDQVIAKLIEVRLLPQNFYQL